MRGPLDRDPVWPWRYCGSELLCAREHMNVPAEWLAARIGVTPRTLSNWEAGRLPWNRTTDRRVFRHTTPRLRRTDDDDVVDLDGTERPVSVYDLLVATRQAEDGLAGIWARKRRRYYPPDLIICRTDAELAQWYPDAYWPAGWYRALYTRIVRRGLDLRIGYPDAMARPPLAGVPWGDEWQPGRTNRDAAIVTERRMENLRRDVP